MKWCETFVLYNFLETLINYKIYFKNNLSLNLPKRSKRGNIISQSIML